MWSRIERFFGPPLGALDTDTVRARLLGHILNLHLVIAGCVAVFYGYPSASQILTVVPLLSIPAALGLRVLLHRGMVRTPSWIFLVSLAITGVGVNTYLGAPFSTFPINLIQMMLIVMAGLLLGGRESLGFAVLIVATDGVRLWREVGLYPDHATDLRSVWTLQAIFYTGTAALVARAVGLTGEAFAVAGREAAERRAADAALRENMERYRLITAVSSDYTFSTEVVDGSPVRLSWVAGAFEAITGFTLDEYIARGGWPAALHPDDAAQDALDLEALRQNRPIASELRTICRDGSVRWVRIYAHPVWDQTVNRLSGIYGAVQDIGERKAAEAEREALIRELEARNAELERFTYTVSHDLKSPLITIRSFLGHIEQAAVEGRIEAMKADMERVYKSTTKMRALLDDLLDLSRVGRLAKPPERVPFESIVREGLDRAHGRLAESRATVEVQPNLPIVSVDRDRLVEVIQNLLDNASKFMGDQAEPRISIGLRDSGPERAFFVRDNGVGIPPQYRERVFNLFDKLDPRSSGTGVGLALVKRIVEVHGGRIWVESEAPEPGSTFLFTLGSEALEPGGPA